MDWPQAGKVFQALDQFGVQILFLEATKGHRVILNFSTIPQWMYKSNKPWSYRAWKEGL